MSLYDYEASKKLSNAPTFYALIMAAMRRADSDNIMRLKTAFPWVYEELKKRYNAPGGVIKGDPEYNPEIHERRTNIILDYNPDTDRIIEPDPEVKS